ncbi:peptidoglycan D,D-transpeptidase FtsI family protein [Rubrobacter radiotolerans]|uniref:Penicillin-binding protein 2 n=1 Tax=Rubrobacter radiotolerans TaxID=42256 RepID=A0AB35TB68_RUBRA|nr:penicillin-binding protein 2 [Rubrobacter radiotolerans]MDX5894195.1 penicillin-binding protein 2 [Rubrobacter radiotolerans]
MKRRPAGGTGRGRTERRTGLRRVEVVLLAFALATVLLLGRAVYMSVADARSVTEFVASHTPVSEVEVTRGDILSADGRALATSVAAVEVIATPRQVEDPDGSAARLAEVIGSEADLSREEISALLSATEPDGSPGDYSLVATVSPETAERVAELGIVGVYLDSTTERVYPDGRLAAQVIGNYGSGGALGGIEARYDRELSSGRDVELTLDTAVQQELQSALAEAVKEFRAKGAVGVVMRVEDGALVALASSPTYDNNDFSDSPVEVQRNRAITDPYEPGSTLKPFTFAGALEEGAVEPGQSFLVPDNTTVGGHVVWDSVPHEPENMDLPTILADSSNVGTIEVARALGEDGVYGYLADFGFGRDTSLDLPGEDPGYLPERSEWSGVSIGNIPIGQGLTVTPVQLAAAYATLAGGERVQPHISGVEKSRPEDGTGRVISERTSDIVRTMLQSVVEDGTGRLAAVPGYTVAGKTGTSEKVDPKTGTYGDEYYASFAGFAPATDPEYVVVVVVDEPRKSIWGESVAAPAFRKVMEFTLGYFNVPPDRLVPESAEQPSTAEPASTEGGSE